MTLEKATPADSSILTEITKKSKEYWGYSKEQIESWADDLTVPEDYLIQFDTYKLMSKKEIIGYYSFIQMDNSTVMLDNMFVLPEYIGKGYGNIMMKDFLERAADLKTAKIVLEADPHAEKFYQKFGFEVVEKHESSIPGRFIPVMVRLRSWGLD